MTPGAHSNGWGGAETGTLGSSQERAESKVEKQAVGQMLKSSKNEEICPGKLGMTATRRAGYELAAHGSWAET